MSSALSTARSVATWPYRTTRDTLGNVREVLGQATPEDLIPPWVYEYVTSTLRWMRGQFVNVAGYRSTPYEQMTASIALAVMMVIASLGILTWLAPIMLLPFLVGAARLVPVVDRLWPFSASAGGQPT